MSWTALPWLQLAPIVIPLVAGVVATLGEVLWPARWRRGLQACIACSAVLLATCWAAVRAYLSGQNGQSVLSGHLLVDPLALYLQAGLGLVAFLTLLVVADRTRDGEDAFTNLPAAPPGSPAEAKASASKLAHSEVYPLILFAISGMMLFPAAGDLLTMFVALELLSLPLYVLTGLGRYRRDLGQAASARYFLLGSFASACFLFGAALVYGSTGSVVLLSIGEQVQQLTTGSDPLLFAGLILVLVGLAFKVGAAPFHVWMPDTYEAAPPPVTALLAGAAKVAAVGALLRLAYTVLAPLDWDFSGVLWLLAIVTMVVGTLVALAQTDLRRLLAYSAIAHVGFMLVGLVCFTANALSAVLFYLFTYGVATVGGFAVLAVLRLRYGQNGPGNLTVASWRGLGRAHPVLAAAMSLFLLAYAGIPLTAGFVGKLTVFSAAAQAAGWPLVIVGIACSAAAVAIYARVIVAMFFADPVAAAQDKLPVGRQTDGLSDVAIVVASLITVGFGLWPEPLLKLAEHAAALLP